MINPIYNLPDLNFVGGESKTFTFNLLTKSGVGFDAKGCDIAFSIISYSNKSGLPIITKEVTDIQANNDGVYNTVNVSLSPTDTVGLYGRYIYQLSIRDVDGETEIPGQGIINITRNIHQDFITNG